MGACLAHMLGFSPASGAFSQNGACLHNTRTSGGFPLANIKSQIKRNRQNLRRRERNKAVRSELKTRARQVRAAADGGDSEAADQALRQAIKSFDKAAAKGVVHKNKAARAKSRLAKKAAGA